MVSQFYNFTKHKKLSNDKRNSLVNIIANNWILKNEPISKLHYIRAAEIIVTLFPTEDKVYCIKLDLELFNIIAYLFRTFTISNEKI